jgi:hypothetical protein
MHLDRELHQGLLSYPFLFNLLSSFPTPSLYLSQPILFLLPFSLFNTNPAIFSIPMFSFLPLPPFNE